MLIDAHCHLDFPTFLSPSNDQSAVIDRALAAGVSQIINVGCDLRSSETSLALAQKYDFIFCTLGVHPNEAGAWNEKVEQQFRKWIEADRRPEEASRRIVGIGEVGLDYFRLGASKETQQNVFLEQIRLAQAYDLPVMIHCRDAMEDVFSILEEFSSSLRVVFHCFSGDLSQAQWIWEKGWATSFAAVVSYPKNEALREVVKACPKELYFLETDAPFLPHQQFRGKRNEPSYLLQLAETVAEVRRQPLTQVMLDSTQNVRRFLRLA